MAYLSQVKAGGKQYIYLTEYCGNQEFGKKFEKHVFGFGNHKVALKRMKNWLNRFETDFPNYLRNLGYTKMDLENWIKTIETGITKTGRKFKIKSEKKKKKIRIKSGENVRFLNISIY